VARVDINGACQKALLLAFGVFFCGNVLTTRSVCLPLAQRAIFPVTAIMLGAICGVFALGILGLILDLTEIKRIFPDDNGT
jgi:hypothetical protein